MALRAEHKYYTENCRTLHHGRDNADILQSSSRNNIRKLKQKPNQDKNTWISTCEAQAATRRTGPEVSDASNSYTRDTIIGSLGWNVSTDPFTDGVEMMPNLHTISAAAGENRKAGMI